MPEPVLVKVECDHCGCDMFVLFYVPQVSGYHVECDGCGTVFYVN